jgi:hypothetical protein
MPQPQQLSADWLTNQLSINSSIIFTTDRLLQLTVHLITSWHGLQRKQFSHQSFYCCVMRPCRKHLSEQLFYCCITQTHRRHLSSVAIYGQLSSNIRCLSADMQYWLLAYNVITCLQVVKQWVFAVFTVCSMSKYATVCGTRTHTHRYTCIYVCVCFYNYIYI